MINSIFENKYKKVLLELNVYSIDTILPDLERIVKQKTQDLRILNWFKTKYIKWIKSNSDDEDKKRMFSPYTFTEGDPEWTKSTYEFIEFNNEEINKINHFIDYFNTLDESKLSKLDRLTYENVKSAVENWDADMKNVSRRDAKGDINTKLAKWSFDKEKKLEIITDLKNNVDYKILYKVDKLLWVQHLTKKSLKCEGDEMGHCVGGYDPATATIISLWDINGNSKATLEINKKNVKQIKGYANSKPKQEFVPYIQTFIEKNDLDVVGDGEVLGMVRYENKYYFPTDPKWHKIFTTKILPNQNKTFQQLQSKISYK